MPDSHLESLYQEAKSAIKARDYEYACELLKRILAVDENYKDTSRLLAKAVRLRKRRWYNDLRLWGTLGTVGVFILGFVIAPKIGGYFASSEPLITPSPIVTNTAKPTATPNITPTHTPRPTPIVTPIPAWVTDFAEPILLAIQDHPPDFQDDFSQVSPGWSFKSHTGNEYSKMEITDGVLQMTVGAMDIGDLNHPEMRFNNFVFQIDVNLTRLGSNAVNIIFWRSSEDGALNLSLERDGTWQILYCGKGCDTLASGRVSTYPYEKVPIRIISKGTEYAIFINETPLSYLNDSSRLPGEDISLSLHTSPVGLANVPIKYDNLKVWDLDKIPNLP